MKASSSRLHISRTHSLSHNSRHSSSGASARLRERRSHTCLLFQIAVVGLQMLWLASEFGLGSSPRVSTGHIVVPAKQTKSHDDEKSAVQAGLFIIADRVPNASAIFSGQHLNTSAQAYAPQTAGTADDANEPEMPTAGSTSTRSATSTTENLNLLHGNVVPTPDLQRVAPRSQRSELISPPSLALPELSSPRSSPALKQPPQNASARATARRGQQSPTETADAALLPALVAADATAPRAHADRAAADAGALSPPGRQMSDSSRVKTEPSVLVFCAGTEGSGIDALGGALMRLPQVRPMALAEESSFAHLWWNARAISGANAGADGRDVQLFRSVQTVFGDYVRSARAAQQHVAFGARGCLRYLEHPGCSWVAASELQLQARALGPLPKGASIVHDGEEFSYPFMQTGDPGAQRLHYPRLADLLEMSNSLTPPVALRVLALWRPPLVALARVALSKKKVFWRPAGLTSRLYALALQVLQGGQVAYEQMLRLPSDCVRLVDVEALLASPGAVAAPMALFLRVSPAQLSVALNASAAAERAFASGLVTSLAKHTAVLRNALLEAEGEAARAHARRVEAGEGSKWWATEMPKQIRLFGSVRFGALKADARATGEQQGARVDAKGADAAAGVGGGHGGSVGGSVVGSVGGADEPSLSGDGVLFTHVLNPFAAANEEHVRAVRLTLQSVAVARAHAARHGVRVEAVAAVFARDRGIVANMSALVAAAGGREALGCCSPMSEVLIEGDLTDALAGAKHPLPHLKSILQAGYQHGTGEFLIYSNIDIALQRDCYVQLASLLRDQPSVPITAVREEFEHAGADFGLAQAEAGRGRGLPHPGYDLWAFRRAWVPKLALSDVVLGVSLVALALNQALIGQSGCQFLQLSRQLTFHVVEGESTVKHKWLQRARNDPLFRGRYTAYNCVHIRSQLARLSQNEAFRSCWYGPQVLRGMNGYKCATHVSELPSELQRQWEQASTPFTAG